MLAQNPVGRWSPLEAEAKREPEGARLAPVRVRARWRAHLRLGMCLHLPCKGNAQALKSCPVLELLCIPGWCIHLATQHYLLYM